MRASLATPVGFVPTMGALHAGHASLVRRARAECSSVVASIFVNPLQFGPGEDLDRYPRTFDADAQLLGAESVDVLFAPDAAAMYPDGMQTTVSPGPLARHLEGERRPGHFAGVATIVLKLFNIVTPHRAYFGEKDAQQLAVVRRLVADLDLPAEIVGCSIVRESDGLAVSSRNRYLDDAERRDAPGLFRALRFIAEAVGRGARDLDAVMRGAGVELGALRADYLALVELGRFEPLSTVPEGVPLVAVGAAFAGKTRLIDAVQVPPT